MRTSVVIIGAALALLPAVASAQLTDAERRMQASQQRLQQFEQNQRIQEVERRVDDLELRLRSEENVRKMEDYSRNYIPPPDPPIVRGAAPALPADLAEAERRRQASLAASEEKLRIISEQMKK